MLTLYNRLNKTEQRKWEHFRIHIKLLENWFQRNQLSQMDVNIFRF